MCNAGFNGPLQLCSTDGAGEGEGRFEAFHFALIVVKVVWKTIFFMAEMFSRKDSIRLADVFEKEHIRIVDFFSNCVNRIRNAFDVNDRNNHQNIV